MFQEYIRPSHQIKKDQHVIVSHGFMLNLLMLILSSCLLYKHIAMDGFSSALGTQGKLTSRSGRRRRQARGRRPTPDHPEMVALNGRQVPQYKQSGFTYKSMYHMELNC